MEKPVKTKSEHFFGVKIINGLLQLSVNHGRIHGDTESNRQTSSSSKAYKTHFYNIFFI